MQLYLTGFMEDKTGIFMEELVSLLHEARESTNGVPPTLVREKEIEFQKKKEIVEQAKLLSQKTSKWQETKD